MHPGLIDALADMLTATFKGLQMLKI
jgi:hypothetical protein